MANEQGITIPEELVRQVEDDANYQVLRDESTGIYRFLAEAYRTSILLFRSHQMRLDEQINEAGGIANIEYAGLMGGVNKANLKNGNSLSLSTISRLPIVTKPIQGPANQVYSLDLKFSGPELGFSPQDEGIDVSANSSKPIHKILHPDFQPSQVTFEEQVALYHRGKVHQARNAFTVDAKGLKQQLELVEEGDPTEGKLFGLSSILTPSDAMFWATVRDNNFPDGHVQVLIKRGGEANFNFDSTAIVERLTRLGQLAAYGHQQVFGRAVPEDSVLHSFPNRLTI